VRKSRGEAPWLTRFLRAVYPEMTDLAVTTAHTEEVLLTHAAERIEEGDRWRDEALAARRLIYYLRVNYVYPGGGKTEAEVEYSATRAVNGE